ncbi:CpsB/CapC family capsule biosynthesis tyrosine phosphatase [Thermosipho atlanticus]|uniref:protein-tyrosine-phosphatase n=1 Tax=Thermosipho atlanticus DSM 15807 TaxID=1123380 RepID=A0A1M5RQH2_9BACT|nr:CpsB/CapC family capsule biosynthesis tyrosine phosphatase [Thermosipho atlanticus]SHH28535.1 protein-tyrosine phosphatase [Thermosipho atlanticus DSM 15807]
MLDMHTHILPAVDDGIKTEEEAFLVLEEYKKKGINIVVFTPHVNHYSVKTSIEKISDTYKRLKPKFDEIGVKTFLGSEIYLTEKVEKFIPINDYFLLLELPRDVYPMYLLDKIFEFQLEGYEIILAHVERYKWLKDNELLIDRLKTMNVYFQMNFEAIESDNYFLKNSLIDFLSTDCHGNLSEIDFSFFEKYKDIFEKSMEILNLT